MSCADFFLVPKLLIIFPEFKYSNGKPAICAGKSMLPRLSGRAFGHLFSRRLGEAASLQKMSRNSRGEGVRHDSFL
jgi:hypothetical protein